MNRSIFTVLTLCGIFLMSCGGSDSEGPQGNQAFRGFGQGGVGSARTTSVETKPVEIGTIADQVRSYGNIKAQNVVQVNPQVSNRITRIYVDLGDSVRPGQVLAKIYDATFRDQLNQARSQLEQARVALRRDSIAFARQQTLMEQDLTSDSEFEIAEATYRNAVAQFESAKASVTQAQENFSNTEVRSPVRGVISARNLEEGDLATTGTALFEVASTTGYESRIFLPVQDWRAVQVGQPVNMRVSNEDQSTASGSVTRKSPQLDPTTGLGEVVVTLNSLGQSIFPGVLVENIIAIETKENALIVPRSALVEQVETVVNPETNTIDLERTFSVFVSLGDTVAERRILTLGIEQGDRIEVLNGLNPGDNIIVIGQQSLEDGSRINVAGQQNFQSPERPITTGNDGQQPQGQAAQRNGAPRGGNSPLANMSPEERQRIQQQMQGMNPDERRAFIQQLRQSSAADSTANN
ncbi:efflux RND transporter periplasmic adaptor subunit [Balneola sp. MJW-20]|uniref:efflux RND transporter periplasmic adaptor subunit n=1 Tax=Gracilimonas aurantiaca TaxID=3234185 RepID=UPI0034662E34